MAIELPKIGERERERESCMAKKQKILDPYSTKCTYFHVSVYFDRSSLVYVYVMFKAKSIKKKKKNCLYSNGLSKCKSNGAEC